jgi:hypothetical protein
MARRNKRKTTRKTYRRRRSSMAGVGGMITDIAGTIVGAIAAKQLNKVLTFDAKILAAAKIALGVMLPKFIKSPIMNSVGQGMIAVGGTELVGAFIPALGGDDDVVLLSGYNDDMSGLDVIGQDISEINGDGSDISEVNGFDEY